MSWQCPRANEGTVRILRATVGRSTFGRLITILKCMAYASHVPGNVHLSSKARLRTMRSSRSSSSVAKGRGKGSADRGLPQLRNMRAMGVMVAGVIHGKCGCAVVSGRQGLSPSTVLYGSRPADALEVHASIPCHAQTATP